MDSTQPSLAKAAAILSRYRELKCGLNDGARREVEQTAAALHDAADLFTSRVLCAAEQARDELRASSFPTLPPPPIASTVKRLEGELARLEEQLEAELGALQAKACREVDVAVRSQILMALPSQ
jgi:hypothetical protein